MPFTLFMHLNTPEDMLAFFKEHNAIIEEDTHGPSNPGLWICGSEWIGLAFQTWLSPGGFVVENQEAIGNRSG